MYKTALVGLAALSLSACASLGPLNALNAAAPFPAKVEATALDIAEAPIVVADRAGEPEAVAMMASPALMRRNFGSPTRRQPDLRLVLATAVDRARFSPRRRAWRRRALRGQIDQMPSQAGCCRSARRKHRGGGN